MKKKMTFAKERDLVDQKEYQVEKGQQWWDYGAHEKPSAAMAVQRIPEEEEESEKLKP